MIPCGQCGFVTGHDADCLFYSLGDDTPEWQCDDCGGTDCHLCQAEWRDHQKDIEAEEKLGRIKTVSVKSYQVTVFIAGELRLAKMACRRFCDEMGECVTVEPTDYIYTGGQESGVRIGFINYGRFPRSRKVIFSQARALARWLLLALEQESVSIVASDKTEWLSTREETK